MSLDFFQAGVMEDSSEFGFIVFHCLPHSQIGILEIAAIAPFESQFWAQKHPGPPANQTTEAPAVR